MVGLLVVWAGSRSPMPVGDSAYITALGVIWIGGMVLFGFGGLMSESTLQRALVRAFRTPRLQR